MEDNVPWAVAGRVNDFEGELTNPNNIAVRQLCIRRSWLLEGDSVRFGKEGCRIVYRPIQRVKMNRHVSEMAPDCGHCSDMVQMRVCKPDSTERRTARFDHLNDLITFIARIDNYSVSRLVVYDEIRILLERADRAVEHLHTAYPPVPTIRPTVESRSEAIYFSAAIAAVVPSPAAVVTWRVS